MGSKNEMRPSSIVHGSKDLEYWNRGIECMPKKKIQEMQNELIAKSIRLAHRAPFYKKRFKEAKISPEDVKDADDLTKIPTMKKSDVRKDVMGNPPFGSMCPEPFGKNVRIYASTGTTGKPTYSLWTRNDLDFSSEMWARAFWGVGLRPEDMLVNTWSQQLFVGHLATYGGTHMGITTIAFGTGASERLLLILRELKANAMVCTPSYAFYLHRKAIETGIELRDIDFKAIVVGGEPFSEEVRKRIREMWNCDAFDGYGMTEITPLAVECRYQTQLHFYPDWCYYEALDRDTGERVDFGEEGVLTITTLNREGYPLIRYWTGDNVILTDEGCECGRTYIGVKGHIKGRLDDMLKVRGVRVWPQSLYDILAKIPEVGEWRIVIRKEDEIIPGALDRLNLEIEYEGEKPEEARKTVEEKIKTHIGVYPTVKLMPPNTLERFVHKTKRVIDLR